MTEYVKITIVTIVLVVMVVVVGYYLVYHMYCRSASTTTIPSYTTYTMTTYSCIVHFVNATVSYREYNSTHILAFLNLTLANYDVTPAFFTNLSLYINNTYVEVNESNLLLKTNLSQATMHISLKIGYFPKNSSIAKLFKPGVKARVYVEYTCFRMKQTLLYKTVVTKI